MSELLVIGNGFFAQNYEKLERANASSREGLQVHQAGRHPEAHQNPNSYYMDMLDPGSIVKVLEKVQPDIIVNGAAILGRNNDKDKLHQNPTFARNLLEGVHRAGMNPRVVILGSSSVYGVTSEHQAAVESAPMNPLKNDLYGQSKKEESIVARDLADQYGVRLVEARLFNPLGPELHPSNLISRVVDQVVSIRNGEQEEPAIRVRNLDVERDYSHVLDQVHGISVIAHAPENELRHDVYNIGSGMRTSNRQLIDSVLHHIGLDVPVEATDTAPEPVVGAAQADIGRLRELGWRPQYDVSQAVAATVAHLAV